MCFGSVWGDHALLCMVFFAAVLLCSVFFFLQDLTTAEVEERTPVNDTENDQETKPVNRKRRMKMFEKKMKKKRKKKKNSFFDALD